MTTTVLDKIKAYKLEEIAADRLWPDRGGQEGLSLQRINSRGF